MIMKPSTDNELEKTRRRSRGNTRIDGKRSGNDNHRYMNSIEEESKEPNLIRKSQDGSIVDTSSLPLVDEVKNALDSDSKRGGRSKSMGPAPQKSNSALRRTRNPSVNTDIVNGYEDPMRSQISFVTPDSLHADFYGTLNQVSRSRVGNTPRSSTSERGKKTKYRDLPTESKAITVSASSNDLHSMKESNNTLTSPWKKFHNEDYVYRSEPKCTDKSSQISQLQTSSPKEEGIPDGGNFIIDDSPAPVLVTSEDIEYLEKNDAVSPSVFMSRDKLMWELKGRSAPSAELRSGLAGSEQELAGEWIGEAMDLLQDFLGVLEKEDSTFFETHSGTSHKFKRITHLLGKARNTLVIRLPQIERELTTSVLSKKQEDQKQDKAAAEVSDWISKEYAKKTASLPISSVYSTARKRSSIGVVNSRINPTEFDVDTTGCVKSVRSHTLSAELTQAQQSTNKRLEKSLTQVASTEERNGLNFRQTKFRGRSHSLGSATASEYLKYSPEVLLKLIRCGEWSFDVFEFGRLCNNRPLQVLVSYLFKTYNLHALFQVSPETLNSFLVELESAYLEVAYHNNYHAADVVQSFHFYLCSKHFGKLVAHEDIFAGIIAAAIHDVGHPGNNNHFEIAAFSQLAVQYNDRSVLENYHLATGFRILQRPECNIFANLSLTDRRRLRETIILMVLATDMQQHMHLVAKLQAVLEQKRSLKIWFSPKDLEDRRTLLTIGIHTADISSASKKLPISLEWAHRIHEEFWFQGDKERNLGLPVSAVMDRSRPNLQKSQIGFITLVVEPLYKVFVETCPELIACIQQQDRNLEYWKARVEVLAEIKKRLIEPVEDKKDIS